MSDDPWIIAWELLKAAIDSGATREEVDTYALELGARLPSGPDSYGPRAQAVQHVITDILNGEG